MLVNRGDPCYLYRSEALIDQTLSIDVFQFLLGHLDTNTAKSVSKYWYTSALSRVKELNIHRLSKVCSTLNEEGMREISRCDTFLELQAAILKMRDKAVEILKPLNDDELDKRVCEPWMFFEHTISLTKVCKAMDSAKTCSGDARERTFDKCVLDLAFMHMYKKAIGIAKEMQTEFWRQLSFANISSRLTDNGKFAYAIDIQLTEMKMGYYKTDESVEYTALAMSRTGQIQQANMHAENIQDPYKKANCLGLIEIVDLCQQDKFKEAETQADTYRWDQKSEAYLEISRQLHLLGRWEECLRVTDAIPIPGMREHGLNLLRIQIKDDKAKLEQVVKLLGENNFYL